MTLVNVHDMELKRIESMIKEVTVQAQGEVLPLMLPSSCH
jgi:hypothetical protein